MPTNHLLDQIDLLKEPEVVYQSKQQKTKSWLINMSLVPRTVLPLRQPYHPWHCKWRGQIQNSSGKFCFFCDDSIQKQAVPAIRWKSATSIKFLTQHNPLGQNGYKFKMRKTVKFTGLLSLFWLLIFLK
jgi:hypothetical protein